MPQIERILCPTDFSDGSLQALEQAADIALKFAAEIYVINVIPILTALPTDPNFVSSAPGNEQSLHAEAQRYLDDIASGLIEKGICTTTIVGHGDAGSEIVRIAEQHRVGLIVIATFGKTGWRRFMLGSVTEKVVRLANCPVLSIRGADRPAAYD